jgi:protoporphyrin/coproporphyrin ferrochelatase
MLADTMRRMKADGVRRALAWVTSAFSCYSGCRQYREDIESARARVGDGAPSVDKIRVFYNHPGFIHAQADRVRTAMQAVPETCRSEHGCTSRLTASRSRWPSEATMGSS